MKIRKFKGQSLEKIYDAIKSELGPGAIVVSSHQASGGMFGRLVPGGGEYEVVAVVDDHSHDRHQVREGIGRDVMSAVQDANQAHWHEMARQVQELQREVRGFARQGGTSTTAPVVMDGPAAVRTWDPRFLNALRANHPEFFTTADETQRLALLGGYLPVHEQFLERQGGGKPHVVVMVGPTGAGKTTTIAKLAARWSLQDHRNVGLVTADTFRVAAVDQIREYATLLGLELKVACTVQESARAVREMRGKDVILVDTAGRSLYDRAGLAGLRGILQALGEVTVLLTVPAVWDKGTVSEMINCFKVLHPAALVITKVDETRSLDMLSYVFAESGAPVACLTNGQRVPQDLIPARRADLAGMMLGVEAA